jgi:hypothetical protein
MTLFRLQASAGIYAKDYAAWQVELFLTEISPLAPLFAETVVATDSGGGTPPGDGASGPGGGPC